ncbi:MAG: hypothetical protein IKB86_06070 [Clostridia bacterium]|nr:hypothetical protein [Clostridia bacterium]
MKKITVSDVTFCSLAEEKQALSFREKLNVADCLDACGVDNIELPVFDNDKETAVVYKTIASAVKNACVTVLIDCAEKAAFASETVKNASKSAVAVCLPISTVQMEYQYHLKASAMLEKIAGACADAKKYSESVDFIAKDATRADAKFVVECAAVAKENGATSITVCDDNGTFFPEELADLVSKIKAIGDILVFVQPSDNLKMAAACAISAIKAGADGIKTGIVNKNLTADVLADILRAKGEDLGVTSALDSTKIHHKISQTESIETGKASAEADGALLTADSTIADVAAAAEKLGYELTSEDNGKVYEEFKRVCAKKSSIGARELEAIIATSAMQVPSTFHLVNYVVNSGNIITATANITLERNGEKISGVSTGDGPIDAAFHAIEQIVGHHYELDDFQVQSVTKGREAVGSSLIRLRADDGKLYSGNGISTDIIGACLRAYINALNKIVYEEN